MTKRVIDEKVIRDTVTRIKPVNPELLVLAMQAAAAHNKTNEDSIERLKCGFNATKLPAIVPQDLNDLPEGFKLRTVQEVMFKGLFETYRRRHHSMVIQAPTGAGKTIWAAVLFRRMLTKKANQRLVFIVPRINLLHQTKDVMEAFTGQKCSVIQGIDPSLDFRHQIYVATIQTLSRRISSHPNTFGKLDFGVMIIDECHIQFSGRSEVKSAFIIGLTATPYSRGLSPFYDTLVKTHSATKLTKEGVITDIKFITAVPKIDADSLELMKSGEYTAASETRAVKELIGDIVQSYLDNKEIRGIPFLAFCKNIASCVDLSDKFNEAGIKTGFIHSKMSQKDCTAILDLFKQGLLDGVISVMKLVEGFDYPAASVLIMATSFAPDKFQPDQPAALSRYVQMLGRVRRSHKGKKFAVVHDHGDNFRRFGHPDDYDENFVKLLEKDADIKKKDIEEEEIIKKERNCSLCGAALITLVCGECGEEQEAGTQAVEAKEAAYIAGKMIARYGKRKARKPNAKLVKGKMGLQAQRSIFEGLRFEYDKINTKRRALGQSALKYGWIYYKFKDITGEKRMNFSNTGASRQSSVVTAFLTHERIKYAYSKKR